MNAGCYVIHKNLTPYLEEHGILMRPTYHGYVISTDQVIDPHHNGIENRLVDVIKERNIKVIIITCPFYDVNTFAASFMKMWKEDLSMEMENVLCISANAITTIYMNRLTSEIANFMSIDSILSGGGPSPLFFCDHDIHSLNRQTQTRGKNHTHCH